MKNLKKLLTAVVVVILLAAGYLFTGGDDADQAPAVSSLSAESSSLTDDQSDSTVKEQPAVEEAASASEKTTVAEEAEEEPAVTEEAKEAEVTDSPEGQEPETVAYYFRNKKLLNQHYEKHGIEMGFASAEDYEKAASDVVNNPNALTKKEAEDNDDVYYVEATNEFVVVSTRGFIRTYFKPNNGKKYYDKQ